MNRNQRIVISAVVVSAVLGLAGCGGMSQREENTAIGAAAGAAAGALITDGDTVGTLGGAAVGGLIGHELTKDKNRRRD